VPRSYFGSVSAARSRVSPRRACIPIYRTCVGYIDVGQSAVDRPINFRRPRSSLRANVRFGSKADIEARQSDVRSSPESGHCRATDVCPLSANSGSRACMSVWIALFPHGTLRRGGVRPCCPSSKLSSLWLPLSSPRLAELMQLIPVPNVTSTATGYMFLTV
jgi:hypothetical protein